MLGFGNGSLRSGQTTRPNPARFAPAAQTGRQTQGPPWSREGALFAIRPLLETPRQAVEAGLAVLEAGGDFADGVIAHEGNWLGADAFVTFDKKAVALLKAQNILARLLP